MIKAVIFDLDDTLISEREYIKSGYKHVSKVIEKKYGGNQKDILLLLNELFKDNSENVFNRILDSMNIEYTKFDILELVDEYRKHKPEVKFYEDALPCLESLKEAGIKLGIITDGYANAQRKKLKAVNADEYFDEIIVTDELGREFWKPHPRAFMIIKEKFDLDFEEMIYIGDNISKDFITANKLGYTTVLISRNEGIYFNSKAKEKEYRPKIIIENLKGLLGLLN